MYGGGTQTEGKQKGWIMSIKERRAGKAFQVIERNEFITRR
jgi:hypothetical protein